MTRVAMCPRCEQPLVATFAFAGKEFICLGCGRLFEWLEPRGAEETPELLARMDELKEQWKPIGSAILTHGAWRDDCELCRSHIETHLAHATAEERVAHDAALEQIREIRKAVA